MMRRRDATYPAVVPALALAVLTVEAAPQLQWVDGAAGSATVVLTLSEPVDIADLRSIQVEGYDVEQATLVEEGDSLALSPLLVDLTAKGAPRIREVIPNRRTLVLEAPLYFTPVGGQVLADTAFGGMLCRILQAVPEGAALGITRRWVITYESAALEDVFVSGRLNFRSTVDLSVMAKDSLETGDVLGVWSDSTLATAQATFGWSEARIRLRPEISGRLVIAGSRIAAFDLGLQGAAEATGRFRLALQGQGRYAWDRVLPTQAMAAIPLGHGLQVKAMHRPVFAVLAEAEDSTLTGQTQFRLLQSIRSGAQTAPGGQPYGDAKLNYDITPIDSGTGAGSIRFQVKSLLDLSLGASDFHRISLVHEASLAQRQAYREIRLGGSFSLDQRLDSTSGARGWLLYNRELPLLAPPKMQSVQIVKGEAGKTTLQVMAQPKADAYVVQGLMPDSQWVTWVERTVAVGGRIKWPVTTAWPSGATSPTLPGLAPPALLPLRVRVIAVNAYGLSLPFPEDGLVLPVPNRAPDLPRAMLPENGTVADTAIRLSWKGSDPDSGNRLTYRLLLDTRNPPVTVAAGSLVDSSFTLSGLLPGTTYYWRVRAGDGTDSSESAVLSFTTRAAVAPEPVVPTLHASANNPWVLVPKGAFRREDEVKIQVGPFFLQKYEVTQADYKRVMGDNPSYRLSDSLPVERVTWDEAHAYCQALGGRLPTEAEWEFAGRGGTLEPAWTRGKVTDYAWYRANAGGRTRKVGLLKPNGYGLHDMAGNVFEWVEDWYGAYDRDVTVNPKGPGEGTARVIRGASWYSEAASLNPGSRFYNRPGFRNYKVGFRCAEDMPTDPSLLSGVPHAGMPGATASLATARDTASLNP